MKVTRNYDIRKKVIDLLREERFPPSVYSVTRLICCPRKTYWRMEGIIPEYPDDTILVFARGRGHHSILEVYEESEKKESEETTPPIWKDGIRGDIDMKGERITEIYTTNMKLEREKHPNHVLGKFPLKVLQLTSYCHMKDETEGDLMVFYLMGDYTRKPTIKPELEVYTLQFTSVETESVWKMLLERRALIVDCRKRGVPPIEKGEPFECTNCVYDYLCADFDKYIIQLS